MKVVLYMRYSSERQTEQSIEGQDRVCTAFCKQKGYEIVEKYIDRATSAYKDTAKRLEFNRMIKDSERQLWDGVVVYKLDRFARNRYDSAIYKTRLKKNGVKVISATENISDNPEGIILEAVLEGMAEFYSKELSQKITRGIYESASKCQNIGGAVPLGYNLVNKKLVINEQTAPIVREAFELYASGTPAAEICQIFNSKGYRTAKGAEFNKNSFHSLLKNEKYIGVYAYKDIRIENGVPAIVDKDLFNIVQKRLHTAAKAPGASKAKVDYLLSQKLFCGHCGSLMIGTCGTSRTGVQHHYYTCNKRKREKNCDKKPIRKEIIEKAVVENVISLLTPEMIDKIADAAIQEWETEINEKSVIKSLKIRLSEIKKSIENLVTAIEQGNISPIVTSRLSELENEQLAIEKQILDAQEENYVALEKVHIVWWLSEFSHGNIQDADFCKKVINLFVNSVTVWDESDDGFKITAVYNLTSSPSSTFRFTDGLCGGSTVDNLLPPLETKPNTLFFIGILFGQTTKYRVEM